jgi:hypothetical protein
VRNETMGAEEEKTHEAGKRGDSVRKKRGNAADK